MKSRYITLNKKEGERIKNLIRNSKYGSVEFALNVGSNLKRLNPKLLGKEGMSAELSKKIYELLGKPEDLGFLVDEVRYQPKHHGSHTEQKDAWESLFDSAVSKLKTDYLVGEIAYKAHILKTLEELAKQNK